MRVLITGGGTAGHINPGISIAKYIRRKYPDAAVLFAGTHRGLETKLVPREGFELELIRVRGFVRRLSLENIVVLKELIGGLVNARKIIRRFKPDIVIGTGGYVCGPVVIMAASMRIPTLIHEQNAFPGFTNRLLSRFVDYIAISFNESGKYFNNKKKLIFTGNPIRDELLQTDRKTARQRLGIDQAKPMVAITGGSRGAEKINMSVADMIRNHYKGHEFNIFFATGEIQYDTVMSKLKNVDLSSVNIVPYIYNASDVYNSTDIMVCRGGAITCSELTAIGIPAIIIPSPYVTANHQEYNARALEKQGAAVVILEKDLDGKILYEQMVKLLNSKEKLDRMSESAKKMGITNASEKIFEIVQQLVKLK